MTVIRRIGALVALLVVIAGLPAGLVAAGAPLVPSGLSWAHVRHLLVTPDMTGSVLVWLVSLIGWIGWAWFALAVAAEAVTMLSGQRLHWHMPGPRLARRVAAGLLIAAFAGAPAATSAAHAVEATHVAVAAQASPAHAAGTQDSPATTSQAPDASTTPKIWKTYTVRANDYLWKIAEHYYGDGAQFRRIAEASGIDPHSELKAGQKLILPVPKNTAAVHSVKAGEYLWKIAEHYYGDGAQFHKIAEASGIDAHSDLAVGQKLIIPGPLRHSTTPPPASTHTSSTAAAPVTPPAPVHKDAPAPATTSTAPAHTKTPAVSSADHSNSDEHTTKPASTTVTAPSDEETLSPVQVGLTASVGLVLVAGLITTLNRRYRTRFTRQPRGKAMTLPSPDAQTAEIALRSTGATDTLTITCLDQALRAIGAWCHHCGHPLPPLLAARVDDDRIDLLLSQAAPDHPEAVELAADGSVWTLTADRIDDLLAHTDDNQAAPWPSLVTLGRDDDGAHILIDLEAAGTLHLIADDDQVDAALAAIAVELATCDWSDEVNVTLVGQVCPGLEDALESPTLTRATDVDALLTTLEARADDQRHILTEGSPLAAHRADPAISDGFDAEVILLDTELTEDHRNRLASLVEALPRVSVAAVTTSPTSPHEWSLTLTGDPLAADVAPLGWHIHPQTLSPDLYNRVVELLANSAAADYEPASWWNHDADDEPTTGPIDEEESTPSRRARPNIRLTTLTGGIDLSSVDIDDIIDEANQALDNTDEATDQVRVDADQPGTDTPFPIDDIDPLSSDHPVLSIIGHPDITGATGTVGRSPWRCQQLALYIAEHPGASGATIADDLGLSASTVRSIATHLRHWLGADNAGVAYMPAATRGYRLDERIVTDVDLIDAAVAGAGINTAETATLVAILKLGRGRVFAGVPESELRQFRASMYHVEARIVDAALQVTDRALEAGDLGLARWALTQGLLVSPDHEDLVAGCLRTEYQAGNMDKVSELVDHLSATARRLGVDLNEDTTRIIDTVTHADRRAS
ncbi:LysM peptidoglycan-binding domain-containing protein [Cutibacterium acnes]|uniref:LysM peptidoglycan-binding domain-containing protein n=1 Tax=Cutibacterium acnes TaxID=1747 RepID=UPI000E4DE5CE|nr:LysM peptidoglycan-binding domain-containing protein [Cutibacterium acnes]RHV99201.1 LysM peptidoglycan-binding domain-containing protein [Propionibacterium sp. KPL2009]